MSREREGYRDKLASILEFTGGKHMLTKAQVREFTGIKDYRTLEKRFPFSEDKEGKYITAETLARLLP